MMIQNQVVFYDEGPMLKIVLEGLIKKKGLPYIQGLIKQQGSDKYSIIDVKAFWRPIPQQIFIDLGIIDKQTFDS